MDRMKTDVFIGLVHSPIYNKLGDEITTTITNLDLHDISRAGKTYDINKFFVVNPLKSQQSLVKRMKKYWTGEYGAKYNPNRSQAFFVLKIVDSLDESVENIKKITGKAPVLVATDARPFPRNISYFSLRREMHDSGNPYYIIFGTGWGLTEETLDLCDYILDPIWGRGDFNHLSVRSAVSIILDRLLADKWWKEDGG